MSFEQPVYSFSYPSGEPPTPTKTPTSPNFFLNSFLTPKQDSKFNDSFSPWTPTFPSAASPNSKTPTHSSFKALSQDIVKSSTARNIEAEIASHVHRSAPIDNLPLPPVERSCQLPSSPDPSMNSESKRRRLNNAETAITPLKTSFDQQANQSMHSAGSMQTPPPTSTSASRRKAQQAQVAKLIKESAEKGRGMSFPALAKMDSFEASTSQAEGSPHNFSTLQFSPEGFGFQPSGPATAPVYPQHKLFWDPDENGDNMNVDFPMDDTFVAFGGAKSLDPFGSNHATGALEFPTSPAFDLIGTRAEKSAPFRSPTDPDSTTRTTSSTSMTRKPSRGVSVNPSLLFSSPGRAAEASNMPTTSQKIQDDNLLPYAHQLRDAQMELEMQMSRKPKRKRGPETDSPAVKAALQTLRDDHDGLKQDLADDISSETQRSSSRNSRCSTENSMIQRSRKQLRASRNVVPPHKRASVTLTIDASGRAKTETKVLTNEINSLEARMEVDSDNDKDSTSSSSTEELIMSQTQSFAYPAQQKQPKLGRFTHHTQSHSQKSSYASKLGSAGNLRETSETAQRRSFSHLNVQPHLPNRHHRASFNDDSRDEAESEAETIIDSEEDKGDAQSALKKVLQSRRKPSNKASLGSKSRDTYDEKEALHPYQAASSHPYYISNSITPTGNRQSQAYNISPTTITDPDLATPNSIRSTISSDSVRCLCHGSDDDGKLMIQWQANHQNTVSSVLLIRL
ncbi:hypothetical protein ACLMJK_002514 [Lecanora helva]